MEDLFKDYYALKTFKETKNKLVICIGAGGTGSAFIRDAARLAAVAKEEGQVIRIVACDADIVEESNLKRQCFSPRDIGKNKAAVLAQRYGSTFDIDISYVDSYIESADALNELIQRNWLPNCAIYIFSFVDNVKTRLMIHNFYHARVRDTNSYSRFVWVDSGNTEYAGQVVVASAMMTKVNGATGRFGSNGYCVPDIIEIKRDLLDPANWDKFASELSCEEAAIHHPQTMAANTTAANLCLNMFFSFLFDSRGYIDYNMVTFASNKNAYRSTRIETDRFDIVRIVELEKKKEV